MRAVVRTRYPGAQPFADDPFSRRVFFGREQVTKTLTDQILANRIVVVYAKSGLGKTSLLNAGVAPKLRDEGYLPLNVRVNDSEHGPLISVMQGIRTEIERQQVEYIEGSTESLWSFFKTAEFWRGDLLLKPVLILDQFEELFTLHSENARDNFLSELSFLLRGVRPDAAERAEVSESPPPIRIVVSLREDYLGLLEEAADHLPQIFDHRFRLAPLTIDAAATAMTGPAAIDHPDFHTRPFCYDPEAVKAVLVYLSRHRKRALPQATRYVEPFQLQLICQRVEEIVAKRQLRSNNEITISVEDIGGEEVLRQTLRDFYINSIHSLPSRRVRRKVRRLCEEFLISPEGRRLSLEENEISRQLALPAETLRLLVAKRLLRSDTRSDSSYYELSHDALIEPVLGTRRWRALLFGWVGVGITSLILLFAGLVIIAFFAEVLTKDDPEAMNKAVGLLILGPPFLFVLIVLIRRSLLMLRRYRPRTADELADTRVAGKSRMSALYGAIAISLGVLISFFGLALSTYFTALVLGLSTPDDMSFFLLSISEFGVGVDTIGFIISGFVVLIFGARVLRWGVSMLVQTRRKRTNKERTMLSRVPGSDALAVISITIALLAAVLMTALYSLDRACASYLDGNVPTWIPLNWFNTLPHSCENAFNKPDMSNSVFEGIYVMVFLVEATRLFLRRISNLRITPTSSQISIL